MNRACATWLLASCAMVCGCGEQRPGADALRPLERAVTLYREAAADAAQGEVLRAVAKLEVVAALDLPKDAPERNDVRIDALAEIVRLYLGAGRVEDAERAALRATSVSNEPSYFLGLAWLRLGDVLRAQRRVRAAADAYEKSIAVNRATLDRIAREEVSP